MVEDTRDGARHTEPLTPTLSRGEREKGDRWGYGLVAAAFLWRIPVALIGQAGRDGLIITGMWPEQRWQGWLLLGVGVGLALWPAIRLTHRLRARLAGVLLALVAAPILLRALLTGSLAVDLGVDLGRWRVWLVAWLLLSLTAALANRWGRRLIPWLTGLYGAFLAMGSLVIYYRGHISTGDCFLYQQAFWNTLHGQGFLHIADEGGNHFAVHFSPALLALLPGYALWPSGALLVILQAAATAACLPLAYRLLVPMVGERTAVLGAVGFALLPGVLGPAFGKFHEVSFGLPLLLTAVLGLRQGRGWLFAVGAVGMLLVRETFGVVVAVLGIGAWLSGRRRWGAAALAGGLAWLAVCYLVIMPAFTTPQTRTPYQELYGHLGRTPGQMVVNAARHPGLLLRHLRRPANRNWASEITAPFGGPLPLLSWPGWLGAGETLTVTAARTGTAWPVREIYCHYAAVISAGLWLGLAAALAGLARRRRWSMRVVGVGLVASWLFAAAQVLPIVGPSLKTMPSVQARARSRVVAALPRGASVAAPYDLLPFLAHRRTLYYNSGRQPATDYVVSLEGQAYQRPALTAFREVGRYGPYRIWSRWADRRMANGR